MQVLLSIRKEFSDRIYEGTKRFEFRRRIFDTMKHSRTLVYTTSPISLVTGEFKISDVVVGTPEQVWAATSEGAGIDEARYFSYFAGTSIAYALAISQPRRFRIPLELTSNFGLSRPPQSYAFV
jgi:predicted transcriptional regulator